MKIKEIFYQRTFDLGKFRSEKIGATAEIEELDRRHLPDCYDELRSIVELQHNETLRLMKQHGR